MVFAPEKKSYSDTRKRTSGAYVKFSEDYRVVLRILNTNAKQAWKHWLSEANAGKGMMAVCPNVNSQDQACPVDVSLEGLTKDDPTYLERRAKKKYMVNVLDRTPYTTCEACGNETPKTSTKTCTSCGVKLKDADFKPLNRVKILESGPQLFTQTLNGVEKLQKEDLGAEITDYDITFTAQGKGRDRKIMAMPSAVSEIGPKDLLDPETQEPQQLFDLDLLAEPTPSEEIHLMLQGATMQELNELRGIA